MWHVVVFMLVLTAHLRRNHRTPRVERNRHGEGERRCRMLRLRERSGVTPGPTVQDDAANYSDNSPADGIQGDHPDQQECEHHQGCAALPLALSPCDRTSGNADQKHNGEEHPAGLGEPKPVTEPSPIASEFRHA
jgi:hypothetical protein